MILKNLPAAEYHADKTRISKHGLDLINRAPAVYKHSLTAPHEESPSLRMGSLVHLAVLEPVRFAMETAIIPAGIDRRTKDGKAAWEAFTAANAGKMHVTSDENEHLLSIASAVHNTVAGDLVKKAIIDETVEVTIHSGYCDVAVKARLDGYAMGTLFDIKTARSASFKAFQRAAIDYRYHVQAAWYSDLAVAEGIDVEAFIFVVVETEAPYLSTVYVADEAFIASGRAEYQRDLERYRWCLTKNCWPGLPASQNLTLPAWMEVSK